MKMEDGKYTIIKPPDEDPNEAPNRKMVSSMRVALIFEIHICRLTLDARVATVIDITHECMHVHACMRTRASARALAQRRQQKKTKGFGPPDLSKPLVKRTNPKSSKTMLSQSSSSSGCVCVCVCVCARVCLCLHALAHVRVYTPMSEHLPFSHVRFQSLCLRACTRVP